MRTIVTDVAWSVGLSLGQSVTIASHAKTTDPIDMPFGVWTQVAEGTMD